MFEGFVLAKILRQTKRLYIRKIGGYVGRAVAGAIIDDQDLEPIAFRRSFEGLQAAPEL